MSGNLLLRAEISGRYHLCRAEHFAARNSWISILSIFSGTGVVAGTLAANPQLSVILGMVIAFLNTWRMVTKPGQVSQEHMRLAKAWFELETEVEEAGELSADQLKALRKRANELDSECMEDMRAVKYYCTNDAIRALGLTHGRYKISRFQKWTKHYLRHTHSFDKQNDDFAEARQAKAAEQGEGAAKLTLAG